MSFLVPFCSGFKRKSRNFQEKKKIWSLNPITTRTRLLMIDQRAVAIGDFAPYQITLVVYLLFYTPSWVSECHSGVVVGYSQLYLRAASYKRPFNSGSVPVAVSASVCCLSAKDRLSIAQLSVAIMQRFGEKTAKGPTTMEVRKYRSKTWFIKVLILMSKKH